MQVVHEVHDRIMPLPLPCMMIMVMDAMRFDSKKMAASSSLQVKYVSKCFFHHPLASSRSRYAIEIRPGGCSCISDSDASQPLQKSTELLLLGSGFAAWHIQPLPLGTIGLLLLLWLGAAEENRAQGDDGLSILKWSWVSFGLQLFGHFLGQQHQFLVQAMDGSRPHSKWAPALVSLQQEALLQQEDLQDDAPNPKTAKSVVEDHPSPKKAHFPIDQLDKYHALGYGQPVPRSRSSDAYCMHPQAQSVVAAGQCPSSQCWLQ